MTTIWVNWRLISRWRYLLAILVLFTAGAGANAQGSDCVSNNVPNDTQGNLTWTPAFCQEFNSTIPAPPDTTVWSFDTGGGGFGNNEIEIYCGPPGFTNNPPGCPAIFSTSNSNAYIDGSGHLLIKAFTTGTTWYSARMKTEGLVDFKYGRIEGRIWLPDTTNQGLWPAFWSLGSNIATGTPWPNCGEADFMENWSPQVLNGPGPGGNKTTIHTAVTGVNGIGGVFTFPTGQQANTAFHTYGVISSANMMQFYVDSPASPFLIKTTSDLASSDTWPFNLNIFLLMNIAVGGTLGGTPSSSTPNPAVMMVDYVRQYQASAAIASPTLGNPPSITVTAGATTGNSSTFTPGLTAGTGYAYFSCSTNAPKASCAVATTDPLNTYVVNSSAVAAESVKVTVTTTANSVLPPLYLTPNLRIWLPLAIVALLALMLFAHASRMRSLAWRYSFAIFAGLILVGALMAGCGGDNTVTPPPPTNNGTPPGAYTVTVYAFTESNTGNGANASADANVAIPVTVN